MFVGFELCSAGVVLKFHGSQWIISGLRMHIGSAFARTRPVSSSAQVANLHRAGGPWQPVRWSQSAALSCGEKPVNVCECPLCLSQVVLLLDLWHPDAGWAWMDGSQNSIRIIVDPFTGSRGFCLRHHRRQLFPDVTATPCFSFHGWLWQGFLKEAAESRAVPRAKELSDKRLQSRWFCKLYSQAWTHSQSHTRDSS